ncbi:MAG: acryloyl-CoA reductase [Devosia sp.]|nr:acryloyl-CoA reductase [Devosia sp.]
MSFSALVTRKTESGAITSAIETLDDSQLPDGEVTVAVAWSGVNYKDGLCLTGGGALVRSYPHVGGIDFSGTVIDSRDARYAPGDQVISTGWRVGEIRWGGFAERARVKADWLVPLPAGLTARDAMVLGTAGLTAMLAIDRLEANGLVPGAGEVLVTGAAGGVGTIATLLLSRLGYSVAAMSGRPELTAELQSLGAATIISRDEFLGQPDKVLESARWAAAIDAVGGPVLGKLLKQVKPSGAVAAIGNAAGVEVSTTVLPFILRAVSLFGIDSVSQPYDVRVAAWARLARHFDSSAYSGFVREAGLPDVPAIAAEILRGRVRGRTVIRVAGA